MTGPQDDERLDDLAAVEIGDADDCALGDRGMLEQRALHLERADPVRGRDDHVVGAADEPQVPVLVAHRPVAGEVPAVAECGLGLLGGVPVAREQGRWTPDEGEVALDAGRADVARLVDHRDVVARCGEAHRAGPDRGRRRVRDEERVLGLSVSVVDRHAERVLEAGDDLRVERLAGRDGMAKSREVGLAQRVELGEQPVLGRRLAEHGDTEALDQRQPLLGVEPAVVDHDFGAVRPRPEEHVPDRLRPAGPGGAPDDVALVRVEPVRRLRPLRPRVRMRVDDGLRILRRARRVEEHRLLPRRRVLGRRDRHVPAQLVDGLVEVDDRDGGADLVSHLLDLELERPVGDDEARPGVVDAEREVPRAQHVRARNRDEPALERAEHRAVPVGHLPEHDEHALPPIEPRAQEMRPAGGVPGHVRERAPVDDALAVDERERGAE